MLAKEENRQWLQSNPEFQVGINNFIAVMIQTHVLINVSNESAQKTVVCSSKRNGFVKSYSGY
jgi:hypothetical protein